ncbi:MAG: hypothetical protein FDX30_05960 [Chlorobium sp.]|nr:MAG: hypothetical protein FDX30_05960 [Chlorobium sp.]
MEPLALALSRTEAYTHPVKKVEVVETHISWIFLTEKWAYKVKKAVNLGFLDFTTLEKRHHFCQEELRLNRRLCPDIYHSVVPVVKSGNGYFMEREGEIVDYAVKMVRFDRSMELDRMLSKKLLSKEHILALSRTVADFHLSLPPAQAKSEFGHPDLLIRPVLANFTHTEAITSDKEEIELLESLKTWTLKEHKRLYSGFLQRKKAGFIRQCHGDMHTGNMVLWKKKIYIFDCIEFNNNLSMIDVISDLAFLFMDLIHGDKPELAWLLLNSYLSVTGDYNALPFLRFYTVYRAMVRAKVTAIRYAQISGESPHREILEEHRSYLRLARKTTGRKNPMILLTHGVSGSGKTAISQELAPEMGYLHIRSDIERKRIAGLKSLERSSKTAKMILYSEAAGTATYQRLLDITRLSISEGIGIIVDATFLQAEKRALFLELAEKMKCHCRILHFHAPEDVLMERVGKRYKDRKDASEADKAVLKSQLDHLEPLIEAELAVTIAIDTKSPVDIPSLARSMDDEG